jgi:hypothetical protein
MTVSSLFLICARQLPYQLAQGCPLGEEAERPDVAPGCWYSTLVAPCGMEHQSLKSWMLLGLYRTHYAFLEIIFDEWGHVVKGWLDFASGIV